MNSKVKGILAGIGVAGLATASVSTGYLILNQAANYEEKQIYVMNEFNKQMENDTVSDADMKKFVEDNTYTGFIKDEESLEKLEELNSNVSEINTPVAAAAIAGAIASPLILFDPNINKQTPDPTPEQ